MPSAAQQFDLIVLGAGAAGLMCAGVAARRGKRVALVDHNGQPGRKILVSGGGRCNFTHLGASAANYISGNKHFAKSALAQFGPRDFLELVERYRIGWHEKTLGQLFCDQSARQILDLLLAECEAGKVFFLFECGKISVQREEKYRVETARGVLEAEALVVATGGLSIPKLGATGLGYDLARQFGLKVVEPRPALVPFVLGGAESRWTALAGLAAEVEVAVGAARQFCKPLPIGGRVRKSLWILCLPPRAICSSRFAARRVGTRWASKKFSAPLCRSGWRIFWPKRPGPRAGAMPPWRLPETGCATGAFVRRELRAMPRPRSPQGVSIRPVLTQRPWPRAIFRDCFLLAKWST